MSTGQCRCHPGSSNLPAAILLTCVLGALGCPCRYYSLFTLFMLVTFECTLVGQRRRNLQELRSLQTPKQPIQVYRWATWLRRWAAAYRVGPWTALAPGQALGRRRPLGVSLAAEHGWCCPGCRCGKWEMLPGEALFPGDLISIGRPAGGEGCRLVGGGLLCPCMASGCAQQHWLPLATMQQRGGQHGQAASGAMHMRHWLPARGCRRHGGGQGGACGLPAAGGHLHRGGGGAHRRVHAPVEGAHRGAGPQAAPEHQAGQEPHAVWRHQDPAAHGRPQRQDPHARQGLNLGIESGGCWLLLPAPSSLCGCPQAASSLCPLAPVLPL